MVDRDAAAVGIDQALDHAINGCAPKLTGTEIVSAALAGLEPALLTLVKRAGGERRTRRVHVQARVAAPVLQSEAVVFSIRCLQHPFRQRTEDLSALFERIFLLQFRRKILDPLSDDLVPVEGAVGPASIHHHREVGVETVMSARKVLARTAGRAWIVVRDGQESMYCQNLKTLYIFLLLFLFQYFVHNYIPYFCQVLYNEFVYLNSYPKLLLMHRENHHQQ